MKTAFLTSFLIVVISFSCQKEDTISAIAENYLNEVMDIMEENSINKYLIDWVDFRKKVFLKVGGAQTIKDTYPGITEALILLGDNHSFFKKPDGSILFTDFLRCYAEDVTTPILPENIGYVRINSFTGSSDSEEAISFAIQIQDQIRSNDHSDIIGWIVDLRGNRGGNMWPMLAGIGPILGEGTAGYFIDPDGNETAWGFVDGSSVISGYPVTQLDDSYELIIPNPKVAVLLDEGVISSGEVIAISFIGRINTKSFGTATCGRSTGNSGFTLSDNSQLYLTTIHLADRNKTTYGNPINPDLISNTSTIIQDALEWLEN